MDTRNGYNQWSQTYDTVTNKTRDLEAVAIRTVLKDVSADKILEIGCGTGKNSGWLAARCQQLVAADFSKDMLAVARQKAGLENIEFIEADITKPWTFPMVNLITCSLVLEHIEQLSFVFQQASEKLVKGGLFYLCELHPYKQLEGSRAKFESDGKLTQLEYFIHHISDYFLAAEQAGLTIIGLNEWFDDNNRSTTPRLVSILFSKN